MSSMGGLVVLADGAKKRHRYFCKNKKAANDKGREMRVEREKHGAVAIAQASNIAFQARRSLF